MDYSQVVYSRLLAGTVKNPGLPDLLAQIITAQSAHETGDYTSDVFLQANNGFGYKYTGSDYQHGNYNGYAKYLTLDDSAAELVDYVYRRVADGSFPTDLSTITTPDQYADLLAHARIGPYYEDSEANYAAGISNWFQNQVLTPLQNNPAVGVVVLGVLGLVAYGLVRRK